MPGMIPKFHCMSMKHFLAWSSTCQLVPCLPYQFQQWLKHKAEEMGVCVSKCMELLTLMMCAVCLWVEESFAKNASKVFKCRKCGFKIDRDYNASHIFLMHREALRLGCMAPVKPVVEVMLLLTDDKEMTDDEGDGCTRVRGGCGPGGTTTRLGITSAREAVRFARHKRREGNDPGRNYVMFSKLRELGKGECGTAVLHL